MFAEKKDQEIQSDEALSRKLFNHFFLAVGCVAGFGTTLGVASLAFNGDIGAGASLILTTVTLAVAGAILATKCNDKDYPGTVPSMGGLSRYFLGAAAGVLAGILAFPGDLSPRTAESPVQLKQSVAAIDLPVSSEGTRLAIVKPV